VFTVFSLSHYAPAEVWQINIYALDYTTVVKFMYVMCMSYVNY